MKRQRKSVLLLVLMFLSVSGAALAHVSLRLGVIREGYAISGATLERRRLEEERRKLLLERAYLRRPERIARIARDQLGMMQPAPGDIRVVTPGTVEGGSELATRWPRP